MPAIQWLIGLALVAIGFYFGKYFGAIALPLLYVYYFHGKKIKKNLLQKQPQIELLWAYQALGISKQSNNEHIKKARKKLLNQHHPDKLSPSASEQEKQQATDKINEINRAYKAIMRTREHYEKQ